MKDIIKQHGIIILCVISLVALLLPLATVVCSIDVMGTTTNSEVSMSGFSALGESIFAYFLVICPAILIAMNYVKALGKYKGLLAIVLPAVSLVALIIVVGQAKGNARASNAYASMEVSLSIGIGAILAGLSYISTAIVGAITYHDFNLDKVGLGKLKDSGSDLLNAMQEKFSKSAPATNSTESATVPTADTRKTPVKKAANLNRVDEILALIEKLSKMKDSGILTEDEFFEKKKQLLGEI